MPFGFGKKATPEPEPEPLPEPERFVIGDQPCSERGCDRHDGATCGYVDRRGRRCDTAWCSDHQALFDGHAFCRRHVGTLRAIGLDVVQRSLAPDLQNRAPSLVNWIANDLDERVRALLAGQITQSGLEELGEERVHLVKANDGARRWDRSWKLFDHTGVTLKVTISVAEADDTLAIIRMGQSVLMQMVPPWIDRRINRVDVSPEQDAEERQIFYERIFDRVSDAVAKERSSDDEPQPWR